MNLKEFQDAIERLQHHNLLALEKIYREYFNKIYLLAFSKVRNEKDAYDIAMDVIVKLTKYSGNAKEIKNHVGLLITMTYNTIKDFYRRQSFISSYENGETLKTDEIGDSLWIRDILDCLTDEERTIFIEHIFWDRKLRTIAEEKGKSYITVRRVYKEIKKKIADIYKE